MEPDRSVTGRVPEEEEECAQERKKALAVVWDLAAAEPVVEWDSASSRTRRPF
jgi:hypothetical protein